MSESMIATRAMVAGEWWKEPEYAEAGPLLLPGQSQLSPKELQILQEIGAAVDQGTMEVPPMPKVAMEALELVRSPDPDINDIVECIQRLAWYIFLQQIGV